MFSSMPYIETEAININLSEWDGYMVTASLAFVEIAILANFNIKDLKLLMLS